MFMESKVSFKRLLIEMRGKTWYANKQKSRSVAVLLSSAGAPSYIQGVHGWGGIAALAYNSGRTSDWSF